MLSFLTATSVYRYVAYADKFCVAFVAFHGIACGLRKLIGVCVQCGM